MTEEGRLIYLIGPSGVGKDSLIAYVRRSLDGRGPLLAHRYITRPAEPNGENHIALSADEFAARLSLGCFLMAWQSHGCRYGIGIEVAKWLAVGADVVMNGSRAYLPEAHRRVGKLLPVLVTAPQDVLRQRLLRRGREHGEAIDARIARSDDFRFGIPDVIVVDNGGALETAGERLIAIIAQGRTAVVPAG